MLRTVSMVDFLRVTHSIHEPILVNQDIDEQIFVLDVPSHVDVIREDL